MMSLLNLLRKPNYTECVSLNQMKYTLLFKVYQQYALFSTFLTFDKTEEINKKAVKSKEIVHK